MMPHQAHPFLDLPEPSDLDLASTDDPVGPDPGLARDINRTCWLLSGGEAAVVVGCG